VADARCAGHRLREFLADAGHEVPTALLPGLLAGLGAPAAALGAIEGVSDGLAGMARLVGGALADDPQRRRRVAVGGYATTAVLSAALAGVTAVWQAGVLRAAAWTARGLRVPARNALLADVVPASPRRRAVRRQPRGKPRRRPAVDAHLAISGFTYLTLWMLAALLAWLGSRCVVSPPVDLAPSATRP
jgi:hypothetical protein